MQAQILKELSNKPITAKDLASRIRKSGDDTASKSVVNKVLYAMEKTGDAKRVPDSMPPLWIVGNDDSIKRIALVESMEEMTDDDIENIPDDVEIHMIGPEVKLEREGIVWHGEKGNKVEILINLLAKEKESVNVYLDGFFSRGLVKNLSSILDDRIKLVRNIDF